jgi:hypothetical protein
MVVLKKIKSSTLIETIVALVIVSVLIVICTLISLNLSRSNTEKLKITAYLEMDKMIREALDNEQYFDKIIRHKNYLIELNFKKFDVKNMVIINAFAYDNDYGIIVECNRLIYMDKYDR